MLHRLCIFRQTNKKFQRRLCLDKVIIIHFKKPGQNTKGPKKRLQLTLNSSKYHRCLSFCIIFLGVMHTACPFNLFLEFSSKLVTHYNIVLQTFVANANNAQ